MIGRVAFAVARSDLSGALVRWVFGHAAGVLPVRCVRETARVVAFHHPRPSVPTHIVLAPQVGVRGVLAVDDRIVPFVHEAMMVGDEIARRLATPLALVVNGGASQDVQQLHLHLLSDQGAGLVERETHLELRPEGSDRDLRDPLGCWEVIRAAQEEVARLDLVRPGFSLIVAGSVEGLDLSRMHLVSGPRRALGDAA
ncbi:MAG: HIT domain-containing protein [Thermomicrobiales bacterium]